MNGGRMDSRILTEYAGVGTLMEMHIITVPKAFARWGKFEDDYLSELVAKEGGKPDEKTLMNARKELAEGRAKLEADAARMKTNKGKSSADRRVEDVLAGRLSLDEALIAVERNRRDYLMLLSGSETATPSTEALMETERKYGPITERLKAADAGRKADASRFVQRSRAEMMAGDAAAQGKKMERAGMK